MILFQVDAVPAADVTWWREGVQIENKDEFHIGEGTMTTMTTMTMMTTMTTMTMRTTMTTMTMRKTI